MSIDEDERQQYRVEAKEILSSLPEDDALQLLARTIDDVLTAVYGEDRRFFLCTGPAANAEDLKIETSFVGNMPRETSIAWMSEMVENFEVSDSMSGDSEKH